MRWNHLLNTSMSKIVTFGYELLYDGPLQTRKEQLEN